MTEAKNKNLILVYDGGTAVPIECVGKLLQMLHCEKIGAPPGTFLITTNSSKLVIPDTLRGQSQTVEVEVYMTEEFVKDKSFSVEEISGFVQGFVAAWTQDARGYPTVALNRARE